MALVKTVILTRRAEKDIQSLPAHILRKLMTWVESVESLGLEKIRESPGFHDEPLKGDRKGQRSIRLNKSYRAIYEIKGDEIEFVEVQEVNKHGY